MTRHELILWICDYFRVLPTPGIEEQIEEKLDSVIAEAIKEHEASKKVIKCKALRKKGTREWYNLDGQMMLIPELYLSQTTMREIREDYINVPTDAELVDIEIIVKEDKP